MSKKKFLWEHPEGFEATWFVITEPNRGGYTWSLIIGTNGKPCLNESVKNRVDLENTRKNLFALVIDSKVHIEFISRKDYDALWPDGKIKNSGPKKLQKRAARKSK